MRPTHEDREKYKATKDDTLNTRRWILGELLPSRSQHGTQRGAGRVGVSGGQHDTETERKKEKSENSIALFLVPK